MEYTLIPRSKRGLNENTILPPHPYGISPEECKYMINEATRVGAVDFAKKTASLSLRNRVSLTPNTDDELGELIFTGTGSAIPCKHRNVTGKYLRMSNGNAMLLDVGEGTVGQLLRILKHRKRPSDRSLFDEFRSRIRGIKAVWISHPHADHHLGLLRLITERLMLCQPDDEPLLIMAPPAIFQFLSEYELIDPRVQGSYEPLNCWDMQSGHKNPLESRLRRDLGITNCVSVPVAHCPHSYAIVMDDTAFGRLSYSGDCRPSHRFAQIGRGTDLLIHEATFEDGMEEEAVLKRHSTVGEALAIAQEMGAKSIVLTHFSQRYPRIPPLKKAENDSSPPNRTSGGTISSDEPIGNASISSTSLPVVFAFDFMLLRPSTVCLASELTPALRLLYPDCADDEKVTNHPDEMNGSHSTKFDAKSILSIPGIFCERGLL